MKPSENPLGSEPISTLLRRFAVPSVIAMLVSALYNSIRRMCRQISTGKRSALERGTTTASKS